MHATKLDLRVWIMAIFCILSSSKGISSVALARTIGVTQATTETAAPILADWISPQAELHTDSNPIYDPIGSRFAKHVKVNHIEREYANHRTGASINSAEGYTGNLDRAMVGVWRRVRRHHLQTYLAEICWRWNNRDFKPRRKNLCRGALTAARTTWKWMVKPVMEQMTALLRGALGRQVRRTPNGGLVWPIWPRVA